MGNSDGKPKKKLPPKMVEKTWKPGQSGNPNGRPKLNPIQKALKELTIETLAEVIEAVMVGNIDYVQQMVNDSRTSVIQVAVARSVMVASKKGDWALIERIVQRIVGKIPDELRVVSNNKTNLTVNSIDPARLKAILTKLENDV